MDTKPEEKVCTIFAWRYKPETQTYARQWTIDASILPYAELEKLWKVIHGQRLEIRKVEVDFAVLEKQVNPTYRGDTPEALSRFNPLYQGWWKDLFTQLWVAPEEYISTPDNPPNSTVDLAASFMPQGCGWIKLVLSIVGTTTHLWLSNEFDPIADILLWLEKIWQNEFPRIKIDEEGGDAEMHILPVARIRNQNDYQSLTTVEQKDWLRLVIVRENSPTELLLDIAIKRKILVRTIYTAFINAQISHPDEMRTWPYLRTKNLYTREGPVFYRSPFLDQVLGFSV